MAKPKSVPKPKPDGGRAVEIGVGQLAVAAGLVLVLGAAAWFLLRPAPAAGPETATSPSAAGSPVADSSPASLASPLVGGEAGAAEFTSPEGDPGLGSANAPVTMLVYSDYQCPNCRQFAEEVLPWLKARWIAAGLVKVVFRDFAVLGPESERAAEAARCAAAGGRFWPYHDRLFASQLGENLGTFSDEALLGFARAVGLDGSAFQACLSGGTMRERVQAQSAAAKAQGFAGTPTYVINGNTTSGAIPVARWEELFQLYANQFGVAPPAAAGP